MTTIRHDGSIDGMLAALAQALDAGGGAAIEGPSDTPSLFDPKNESGDPAADTREGAALLARIERELDGGWVRRILRILCSEEPGAEMVALRLLVLAFARGVGVMGFHANPNVRRAAATERRVAVEAHRLKGLMRFRRLADGRLWGPVEPRHNVLAMIAPHFRRRLGGERWLLHDAARGFGIACEFGGDLRAMDPAGIEAALRPGLDPSEAGVQDLWRTYYASIAIRNRTNPKVQRQNMPVRYWRYLVEKT